jgi:hypothetical protein
LMREIVGFAAGIAAGIAGTVLLGTESGRQLRERLASEAEPEISSAREEWDPLLREVARAVRLAIRDLEANAERVTRYVATMAEEVTTEDDADAASLGTPVGPSLAKPGPGSEAAIAETDSEAADPPASDLRQEGM